MAVGRDDLGAPYHEIRARSAHHTCSLFTFHCSLNKMSASFRGRLMAAQPLARNEPYGCGVPYTGAAPTKYYPSAKQTP